MIRCPDCKIATHAAGALDRTRALACTRPERAACASSRRRRTRCASGSKPVLPTPGHGPWQSHAHAPVIRAAALAHAPRRQPVRRLDLQNAPHPMSARPALHMREPSLKQKRMPLAPSACGRLHRRPVSQVIIRIRALRGRLRPKLWAPPPLFACCSIVAAIPAESECPIADPTPRVGNDGPPLRPLSR